MPESKWFKLDLIPKNFKKWLSLKNYETNLDTITKAYPEIEPEFIKEGLRFECQGSGKCCTSHGEYGNVFLTADDRKAMADHLGLRPGEFTKKYCEKLGPVWRLKEIKGQPDCIFLKDKKCTVYEARPTQCRTWPFWPEVMNAKTWKKEVATFCPGVGKGKLWSKEEIATMVRIEIESEKKLGK